MPAVRRDYADQLIGLAAEIREGHPRQYRVVDTPTDPTPDEVESIGLSTADAQHVADAIAMRADYFLTCDKGILKRSYAIKNEWYLHVLLPEDFLLISVRKGAPWPTREPWPWELRELRAAATRLGMVDDS